MAKPTLKAVRDWIAQNEAVGKVDTELKPLLNWLLLEAAEAVQLKKGPLIDSDTGLEVVHKMTKDLVDASVKLNRQEARFLVNRYYQMQESRKRTDNQVLALGEEPHAALTWLSQQDQTLELQIKRALDKYSASHPVGEWSRTVFGIGPVIAAGLLAYVDIEKAPTAGAIWRFGGYDPTMIWEKGQRRPWNADLKVLFWKIGQSFMKGSGNENCMYGNLYKVRKDYEIARNESGANAETAAVWLPRVGKETQAYGHYKSGKLPPSQIDARARRWAVKLFIAHWHEVAYEYHFRKPAPNPYPIVHLGHVHKIEVPNKPTFF